MDGSQTVYAQSQVIHDAEYVRMEQQFGEQWPGMIDPQQEPLDLVQITGWFTTILSIAGADSGIPTDRVIDGVDQSGLLLLGEGKGRRDYVFH